MKPFEGHTFFGTNNRFAASCHLIDIGVAGITFLMIHDLERNDPQGLPLLVFIKDVRDLADLTDAAYRMGQESSAS